MDTDAHALADFVARGGLFVLTGAGLSTESGIPDYRRPDGTRRTVPMTFQQFIATPEARRRYWARSAVGWELFDAARPNVGHVAVAALQRAGLVQHLVTQNVDGLHARAGARDVTELHGSLETVVCVDCGAREGRRDFQARLRELNPHLPTQARLLADGDADVDEALERDVVVPACRACAGDRTKPDVVMFGESVDPEIVEQQMAALARSRSVLVLGSSLKVMSGYRFVLAAARHELPVALVGLGSMRGEDKADIVLREPLGATLSTLCNDLGIELPPTHGAAMP